jgi:hypothetical protein
MRSSLILAGDQQAVDPDKLRRSYSSFRWKTGGIEAGHLSEACTMGTRGQLGCRKRCTYREIC